MVPASTQSAKAPRRVRAQERTPVVAVRASAVTKRDGKDVVLVVQKDEKGAEKLVLRPVQVGAALGDLVQVGGVAAGDRVVLAPAEKLGEGSAVTAAKK